MKDDLDANDLYADLMLMRQVDQRHVLYVEGPEDLGIIGPHVDAHKCRIELCFGKPLGLVLAELLSGDAIHGALVLLDRDFDGESDFAHVSDVVILTDNYDLMMDVLASCPHVLERILANFADRDAVDAYIERTGVDVLTCIVEHAAPIGALRATTDLRVRGFPVHELIDARERGELLNHVCNLAIARSGATGYEIESLVRDVAEWLASRELVRTCSSHDAVAVMAAFLRSRWGGVVGHSGAEIVGRALRAAVDCDCMRELAIYAKINRWSANDSLQIWSCAA
jgi:hypothetical protein